MEISSKFLPHSARVQSKSPQSTKDAYGNVTYSETIQTIECFFSTLSEDLRESYRKASQDNVATVRLFVKPDATIKRNDTVDQIKNRTGGTVSELSFKVLEVYPASDDDGIHHKEVYLMTKK